MKDTEINRRRLDAHPEDIAALTASLEHDRAIAEVEFRLTAQERATLAARLDELERLVEKNYKHLRGGTIEFDDKVNVLDQRLAELTKLVEALPLWGAYEHVNDLERRLAELERHDQEFHNDPLEDEIPF
ncbi:MAG: hypothetical protein ABID84_03585 [Chloroflexota bacterium]